eukprot:6210618-Pleurochrysis_carterae.AAC.4
MACVFDTVMRQRKRFFSLLPAPAADAVLAAAYLPLKNNIQRQSSRKRHCPDRYVARALLLEPPWHSLASSKARSLVRQG